ncbi:hypothetical protein GQX74_006165 [Glossina fuscipes]|nr:hypothetical protein GQX74_006165 [Glossina fuscipes]
MGKDKRLLVPPERPIVYKPNRHEKISNVETFNEGSDIVLVCEVSGVKPIAVHIMTKDRFVSADRTYDIECKSSGSKPQAVITWWKGNKQLKKLTKNFNEPDNQSLSILTYTPSRDDDGKYLTCRAENQYIEGSGIEDKWRLVVHSQFSFLLLLLLLVFLISNLDHCVDDG